MTDKEKEQIRKEVAKEILDKVEKNLWDRRRGKNGRMIELPCGIGDTAYWNNGICITPYRVDGFADYNDDMGLRLIMGDMQPSLLLLGKDLFLDREEAERHLAAEKANKD